MRDKVVFAGCSYTAGNGWMDADPEISSQTECKDSSNLWVNICHREVPQLKNLKLINVGEGGASNTEIFENSIRAISNEAEQIEYFFCQWTSMPRYRFNVGFEKWITQENLHQTPFQKFTKRVHDVILNNGDVWSREYIDDLTNRLLVLHHLHWEILKLVKYTAILSKLCDKFGIKFLFINGICPWDNDYFSPLPANYKPEDLTPFTKKNILNIETRDDSEIFYLYDKAHKQYRDAGGINSHQWLNLYNPWHKQTIDRNHDKIHPGIHTNQLFATQIKNFFNENSF